MKHALFAASLAAVAVAPVARAQSIGERPPELDAVKWYNTPPLALEDLQGQTVMVEVFRTW